MDQWWIRSAAFSCALASSAMVAGPGLVGTAVANAGLLGIGPDIFNLFGCHDNDKKSDLHHPRPGSSAFIQSSQDTASRSSLTTASVTAAQAPTAKVGSQPENLSRPLTAAASAAGGGGGGLPRTGSAGGRAADLPPVSSAPVTRSIVIRGTPHASVSPPAVAAPAPPEATVAVPLAVPPPVVPEPDGQPAHGSPGAPSPSAPEVRNPFAHDNSGTAPISDSYRAGYAEYLKSASTSDLVVAALPGVAGIAGFTLVGAYAGYRQARALKKALVAPAPTSILL